MKKTSSKPRLRNGFRDLDSGKNLKKYCDLESTFLINTFLIIVRGVLHRPDLPLATIASHEVRPRVCTSHCLLCVAVFDVAQASARCEKGDSGRGEEEDALLPSDLRLSPFTLHPVRLIRNSQKSARL